MTIVTMDPEPRYFFRPGPTDHIVVDRLLTPDLFSRPIELDGVILDAPHVGSFTDARTKLPLHAQVLVDPQAFRFQRPSYSDHPNLTALPYSPDKGPLTPDHFRTAGMTSKFVQQVLDVQQEVGATSFVAPGFYVEDLQSAWQEVNRTLLEETLRQTGGKVFATLCASYAALCRFNDTEAVPQWLAHSGAQGVLVLVSPLAALSDSPTKLTNYLLLLHRLHDAGLVVVAARQPAFGLGCMAFGISFGGGAGTFERFDFAGLTRSRPRRAPSQKRPARRAAVYLHQLLTSVPSHVAETIFSTSGLAGSFICSEPCCRDGTKRALLQSRDHFIYTRLREVDELRRLPREWRAQHFEQKLAASRQIAAKVIHALPEAHSKGFRHLDVWLRVFTELRATVSPRVLAGV